MNRPFLPALLCALLAAWPACAAQLPPTDMDNLSGDTVHIPADLKGNPILAILVFAHEQRDEGARVMSLLQDAQGQNSSLGWYELPIIDAPSVARFFIKEGMRGGTKEAWHPRIIPQFVDMVKWRKESDIDASEPMLAKIDHQGNIVKSVPLTAIHSVADILGF